MKKEVAEKEVTEAEYIGNGKCPDCKGDMQRSRDRKLVFDRCKRCGSMFSSPLDGRNWLREA